VEQGNLAFNENQDQVGLPLSVRQTGVGRLSLLILMTLVSAVALGANNPATFTYQGRLMNAAGTSPILDASVVVLIGIYDPSGSCLLYQETQTVSTASTNGMFSIQIGQQALTSGKRTASDPGLSMSAIFANTTAAIRPTSSSLCTSGYTPTAGDSRFLRFTLTPSSTGITTTLSPDQGIYSVPFAIAAQTLQGYSPTDFILVTGNVTSANLATLTGGGDVSALHHHDSRYLQSGSSASLGNNSNVSGNFGIGTAIPSFDLGFGGATNRTIGVNRSSSGAGAALTLSAGGAASSSSDQSGGNLVLQSGTATGTGASSISFRTAGGGSSGTTDVLPVDRMTILGNGNVGIGTTNPTAKLVVSGGATILSDSSGANGGQAFTITQTSAGTAYGAVINSAGAATNKTALYLSASGATNNYGLRIVNPPASASSWAIYSDATAQSYFAGNVGIGTTSPEEKLHVQGGRALFHFDDWGNDTIVFRGQKQASPNFWGEYAVRTSYRGLNFRNTQKDTTLLNIFDNSFGVFTAGSERLLIDSTGKVGIGTATPGNLLDVYSPTATVVARLQTGGDYSAIALQDGIGQVNLVGNGGNFAVQTGTGTTKMRITGDGDLGLGVGIPRTRAHIVKPYTNDGVGGTSLSDVINWGVYKGDMTLLLDTGGTRTIDRGGGIGFSNSDGFVLGAIKGAASNSSSSEFGGYLAFATTGSGSGGGPNGYERMRLDQNGNLGIGTTNPGALLQLGTAGTSLGTMRLTGNTSGYVQIQPAAAAGSWTMTLPATDGASGEVLQTDGNGVTSWVAAGGGLSGLTTGRVPFATSATAIGDDANLFWDNTNKRLGIGTTSPTEILDISKNQNAGTILGISNTNSGAGAYAEVKMTSQAGSFSVGAESFASLGGAAYLWNTANTDLIFATDSTERMRITSTGKVGIGTTTPDARLSLGSGNGNKSLFIYEDGMDAFGLGGANSEFRIFGAASGTNHLSFGKYVKSSNTFTEQMRISNAGNVGIGTTSPNEKLEVNGNIRLTGLNGGGTTTASIDNAGNIIRTASDERLKTQIAPLEGSLERILKVQGVSYYWKNQESFGSAKDIGFIAQDLEKVVPEVVKQSPDSEHRRSVSYANMVAILVEAIKEMYQDVMGHSREIASLKAEVESFKAENAQLKENDAEMKARLDKLEKALNSK
jgi:hypothetical protein